MDVSRVWIWYLVLGFLTGQSSAKCSVGSLKAVKWTIYEGLMLSWNQASEFCMRKGGHLPAITTAVTMRAFHRFIHRMDLANIVDDDVWIGLFSPVPNKVAAMWEEVCSVARPDVYFWDDSVNEPNDLGSSLCIRIVKSSGLWRTTPCNTFKNVVCEQTTGNCTYETLRKVTMTKYPDASKANVGDVTSCWSLCLELHLDGMECVVAVLEEAEALCKLYLGDKLLAVSDISTSPLNDSAIMLKRCFLDEVTTGITNFEFHNNSYIPRRARGPCAYWSDSRPPGVEKGLVDASITTAASSTTPPPTTATTTVPTTQFQLTAAAATAATATADANSTIGTATTAAAVKSISASTAGGSRTVEDATTADLLLTAVTVTCFTTSSNITSSSSTSTSSGNSSDPSETDAQATRKSPTEDLLIPANSTSKYKRSKTSAMVRRMSYTVIGSIWILASVTIFLGFFVLADVPRLKRWLGGDTHKMAGEVRMEEGH